MLLCGQRCYTFVFGPASSPPLGASTPPTGVAETTVASTTPAGASCTHPRHSQLGEGAYAQGGRGADQASDRGDLGDDEGLGKRRAVRWFGLDHPTGLHHAGVAVALPLRVRAVEALRLGEGGLERRLRGVEEVGVLGARVFADLRDAGVGEVVVPELELDEVGVQVDQPADVGDLVVAELVLVEIDLADVRAARQGRDDAQVVVGEVEHLELRPARIVGEGDDVVVVERDGADVRAPVKGAGGDVRPDVVVREVQALQARQHHRACGRAPARAVSLESWTVERG